MVARIDITGQKSGRLTAVKVSTVRHKTGRLMWECLCECGTTIPVLTSQFTRKNTQSCGCQSVCGIRKSKSYPRTPDKYPHAAAEIFKRYRHLVDVLIDNHANLEIEEIAVDLLKRACFIVQYREGTNDPVRNISRYLWKSISYAPYRYRSQIKELRYNKTVNPIGSKMTDVTSQYIPVARAETQGKKRTVKSAHMKFKRC